jgi:hypothetical protein
LLSAFTPCRSPPGSWPIVSQGRLGMISHSRSYGILRCDLYYHRRLWPWLKQSVGTRLAFDGADVAIIIVRGVDEHPLEQEHLQQCNTRPNATGKEPSHQSSVQYIFQIVCIGKHKHKFSSVFWYEFLCTYCDMSRCNYCNKACSGYMPGSGGAPLCISSCSPPCVTLYAHFKASTASLAN